MVSLLRTSCYAVRTTYYALPFQGSRLSLVWIGDADEGKGVITSRDLPRRSALTSGGLHYSITSPTAAAPPRLVAAHLLSCRAVHRPPRW